MELRSVLTQQVLSVFIAVLIVSPEIGNPSGLLFERQFTHLAVTSYPPTPTPGQASFLIAPWHRGLGFREQFPESHLGSKYFPYTFLFPQARTEFLRKKARHQNLLPELEVAEAGDPGSGPVDLFRELLEEGKGVTRGNKEYEEEKRQEKVSWPGLLRVKDTAGKGALALRCGNRSVGTWWGLKS